MSNQRTKVIILLVLQAIALILYWPTFFRMAPQAAVLPPALLLFLVLIIVGLNSGVLSPLAGRSSLIFVQGINIVVRLLMLLPTLKNAAEGWRWLSFGIQIIAIGLSWYTITKTESLPPHTLLLKEKTEV